MAQEKQYNILFLCTANSARSIIAESILNREGNGFLRGYSAGSLPAGKINPGAINLLSELNYPTENLRSKSWDEFAKPDSPKMDFIITVCDNAASEVCPVWPGNPISAHWSVPDPAQYGINESASKEAFLAAYKTLFNRILMFCNLFLKNKNNINLLKNIVKLA